MRIYIKETGEINEIKLREWRDGQWGPDIFGDLADTMPIDFPVGDIDTDAECAMTIAEYKETIEWWEREISRYNAREDRYNWFVENADDDTIDQVYASDSEYALSFDDIPALFRVNPEHRDKWSNESGECIVSKPEIERLAREWGKSVDELMEQVEEL